MSDHKPAELDPKSALRFTEIPTIMHAPLADAAQKAEFGLPTSRISEIDLMAV